MTERSDTSSRLVPSTEAELRALGRLLDAMDRASVPMSARQYRRSSLRVGELLGEMPELNPVRAVCASSVSLRDLLQNELFRRAVANGTMQWSFTTVPGYSKPPLE